jgi:hypothetical protein
MMQEIIRTSRSYIMAIEYASESFEEIPYRIKSEALYKGPYGSIYATRYGLKLLETGFLGVDKGFDNCTYWLLSKK